MRVETSPSPSREEFRRLAGLFPLVPVSVEIPIGGLTPPDAFARISTPGSGFTIESASHEPGAPRFSYVSGRIAEALRTGPGEPRGRVNPLEALRPALRRTAAARLPGMAPFASGAVGYVAYEAAGYFEPSVLPLSGDPAGCPESAFLIPAEMAVFDHRRDVIRLMALVDVKGAGGPDVCHRQGLEQLERLIEQLYEPRYRQTETALPSVAFTGDFLFDRNSYESMVSSAREAVIDGELIQAVVSQRAERPTGAGAPEIYQALRRINPSTYMFLLDFGDFQLIGASPEMHLRVMDGVAAIHPIAGTMPRGETAAVDAAYERVLLSCEKERAEHVMLVDLARNDLGRVCSPGTVRVPSFLHVERYSHVMHLVSRVSGELSPGSDSLDAFAASFPSGTLTGAPKVRAMQLISELEPQGRGAYCGAVGWFDAGGNLDVGTVIRSITLKDGAAHVQGGAGIVFDSVPANEYREAVQKTLAPLAAIKIAERSLTRPDRVAGPLAPELAAV